MDFEELKQKAKAELESAIKKQEELIKKLEIDFNSIDKFKVGNIVVKPRGEFKGVIYYDYYLIADTPLVEGEMLKIPIRHHIKLRMDATRCDMNMSGVIDLLEIPISDLESTTVITLKEMFIREKSNLKAEFTATIDSSHHNIEKYQREIEKLQGYIKHSEDYIAESEAYDFDASFDSAVDKYLTSESFQKDLNSKPTAYNRDNFKGSYVFTLK